MSTFSKKLYFNQKRGFFSLCCAALFIFGGLYPAAAQEDAGTDDPVAIFNLAQDAHEKGDLAAAVRLYDQALKIIPEFPEAEYQKGIALISLNKTDDAAAAFRRAIALRADWTLPMASLGALLVRDRKFAEAEPLLIKAIENNEPNFSAFSALTDLRLQTGAQPAALQDLLAKIKVLTGKANSTASIWISRGLLENRLGDKNSAKSSLNRALEIEPKNQPALMELASIALAENDRTGAGEIIRKLTQTAPESAGVKILEARLLLFDGKNDEALKILNSVADPSPEALTLRDKIKANTLTDAGELEKQLEGNPKNPDLLGRLCKVLRIDNPLKALDYCRRAFDADPGNINYAVGYGAALVQAKRFAEAVGLFRKILPVAPDNATVHANLGIALFELKQFADAKNEYLWLTEKQPDSAVAYYFLAICYDQLTAYADAMANYQNFLRLADAGKNQLEIDKVNLRLPGLQKLIKDKKGKKS